ncbi:RhoGAP [Acrasis kona]|uniref:RhoGAP n=1 Tax=Acrasis kona TaxID=1008807 RepID=A0AAW2ZHX6_9EUKA
MRAHLAFLVAFAVVFVGVFSARSRQGDDVKVVYNPLYKSRFTKNPIYEPRSEGEAAIPAKSLAKSRWSLASKKVSAAQKISKPAKPQKGPNPFKASLSQFTGLPNICKDIFEVINKNLEVEGLFRISGSAATIDRLKGLYKDGRSHLTEINAELAKNTITVHDLTGLVKLFFRELAEPVTGYNNYKSLINMTNEAEDGLPTAIEVINNLSKQESVTLKNLLELSHNIAQQSKTNLMTPTNLGVVWGPNCIKSKAALSPADMMTDASKVNLAFTSLINWYPELKVSFKN